MSYGLNLKIENGFVHLLAKSGDVPEGTFDIWGSTSANQEDLGISRRAADGTFAGSAHHSHPIAAESKPEPGEHPF